MAPNAEQWMRYWKHFERKTISDWELISVFFHHVDVNTMQAEWDSLPEQFKKVVSQYFQSHAPAEMPEVFLLGESRPEIMAQLCAERRELAQRLVTDVIGQSLTK